MTPGLYIADYGGLAGPKTVSLRGLGSPHAAIYIDGVRVGNVQSGQADLGMLDLDNCGAAVIDYAQNSISFNTAKPVFENRNAAGTVKFRGGSFGTYQPSGRLDFRLSDKLTLSATAGGTLSKGDFPLADGSRRTNNDIRQARAGLDFRGTTDGGDWHAKAFSTARNAALRDLLTGRPRTGRRTATSSSRESCAGSFPLFII